MKLKKFEYLIILAIVLACLGIAWAVDENITVTSTAVGLTAAKYGNFQHGICVVETGPIRFTQDGVTTPTSGGVGVPAQVGQNINFNLRDQIIGFQAVRDTSTSAKISCGYW